MQIRAANLLRSVTFWTVIGFFVAANLWSWVRHKVNPVCCDQEATVGFPVPFQISGGLAGGAEFYWLGVLLDLSVILTVALTATWIAQLLRQFLRR